MKNSTWLSKGLSLLSLLFFLISWQFISSFYNPVLLPSPYETVQALLQLCISGRIWEHTVNSLFRGLMGFILSVMVGMPLGLLMGINNLARRFIQPFVVTLQVVPVISWLVLAMVWFGSERVPVFVVVITTLPLIIFNVVQGVMNVEAQYTEMAKVFKVNKKEVLLKIYFPQILPYFLAAMSSALGTTWKAVAMAEFLSAQKGIGAGMSVARINLETQEVFAWTLLLVLLGLLTDNGLRLLQKRLTAWRDDE
ncbi:binding-protein-dependent transport systems inner membrane component [Desulforamulus reducens MI-1]|uniref:Binding-protein-dependent transport systems inner membrane component n=1 Tax=Desulforamulus reducens (strain ATCC BAA-1160 / DSM 100696 / MI-1) TaxID=349161 RepID=A4J1N1_DESRM|nr:ABC transporter permease [Desulforamulus reducens]ABO48984.1 binding-protein-dependent transport systems inner membrane component [Desulforamulus reducens MI-1]